VRSYAKSEQQASSSLCALLSSSALGEVKVKRFSERRLPWYRVVVMRIHLATHYCIMMNESARQKTSAACQKFISLPEKANFFLFSGAELLLLLLSLPSACLTVAIEK
jgi:hypothetical protein